MRNMLATFRQSSKTKQCPLRRSLNSLSTILPTALQKKGEEGVQIDSGKILEIPYLQIITIGRRVD